MGLSKLDFDSSFCISSYFCTSCPEHQSSLRFGKKCSEIRFLIHKIVPFTYQLHRQEISEGKGKLFKLTLRRVEAENRWIFYIPDLHTAMLVLMPIGKK